jgi:hypothetical protein
MPTYIGSSVNFYLADRATRHPLARQRVTRRKVFSAQHVVLAKRHLTLHSTRHACPTDTLLAHERRRETRTPHGLEQGLSPVVLQAMGTTVEAHDHLLGHELRLGLW